MDSRNFGFTLIEMVSTVMIIMIISIILLPFYHNARARQESQLIVVKLRMHLQQAKNNAVLYRSNVVICSSEDLNSCSDSAWETGFISFLDINQNRNLEQDERILSRYSTQLRYGNLRWQGSLNIPRIIFRGDTGLPRGSMGSFYYCSTHDAQHNKVILGSTGIPRNEIITSC